MKIFPDKIILILIPAKKARDFLNDLFVNGEVYIKRINNDRYRRTDDELYKKLY